MKQIEGSAIAGADLSAAALQFTLLKAHSTAGQLVSCAAGDPIVAILLEGNTSGKPIKVAWVGGSSIVKVRAGGNITAGANVAAGTAEAVTTSTAGHYVLGYALEAGADNRIISVAVATSRF
ncbi:MAG: hypothetical protein HC927_07165 [Deltaproteobacteria bacterium]|nr:hypothetical protein [Deltaproteobacteria bacterium]